jgi:putative Holliday junction resolvase
MDGTLGPRAEKSEALAAMLRGQYGLEVVLWDERRTTVDAHRILAEAGIRGTKRKGKIDAVAASLILEGYLNSRR